MSTGSTAANGIENPLALEPTSGSTMHEDLQEVLAGAQWVELTVAQFVTEYILRPRVLGAMFFIGYALSCLLTGTTRDRSWKVYTREKNPGFFWTVVVMSFLVGLEILFDPHFW